MDSSSNAPIFNPAFVDSAGISPFDQTSSYGETPSMFASYELASDDFRQAVPVNPHAYQPPVNAGLGNVLGAKVRDRLWRSKTELTVRSKPQ